MKNDEVFNVLEEILNEYRITLHYASVVRDMLEEEYKREPRPGVGNYGSFKVLCDILEHTEEKIDRLGYLLEEWKPKKAPETAPEEGALYGRRCACKYYDQKKGENKVVTDARFLVFSSAPYSNGGELDTAPGALVEYQEGRYKRVRWVPVENLFFFED